MSADNIHPSSVLGPNVKVSPTSSIGPNCFIDGRTTIGADTIFVGGITLVGDASIGNSCLLEPGICMTNTFLSSAEVSQPLILGNNVRVGAGSVLASGLTVNYNARILAGTIVSRNVPPHAIVGGNPASIVGYSTSSPTISRPQWSDPRDEAAAFSSTPSSVSGVRLHRFPRIRDLRGDLSVGEFGRSVPFEPKRYFVVFDVPSAETRGEHAHRHCEQFLVCVSGQLAVLCDDGKNREEFELAAPTVGLYIPPNVWAVQYKYSSAAVLLVFASHYYDATDYVRDYDQFLTERRSPR